jgi:hypothetical protein
MAEVRTEFGRASRATRDVCVPTPGDDAVESKPVEMGLLVLKVGWGPFCATHFGCLCLIREWQNSV